jgi:hypothetical protein
VLKKADLAEPATQIVEASKDLDQIVLIAHSQVLRRKPKHAKTSSYPRQKARSQQLAHLVQSVLQHCVALAQNHPSLLDGVRLNF